MIVVAIIGILASVAVPQYQAYIARAKVADAHSSMAATKTVVADFYNINGKMPMDATGEGEIEIDAIEEGIEASEYVVSATYLAAATTPDVAKITVVLTTDIASDIIATTTLVLDFDGSGPVFTLDCATNSSVPVKYLPKACK